MISTLLALCILDRQRLVSYFTTGSCCSFVIVDVAVAVFAPRRKNSAKCVFMRMQRAAQLVGRNSGLRYFGRTMMSKTSGADHHNPAPQAHYEAHSAESYEQAFFYEPGAYTEHLCALVRERLQLNSSAFKISEEPLNLERPRRRRVLLDIGGGTGNFTRMIIKDTNVSAIVVDPFLEQSQCGDDVENVQFVAEPAEAFMMKQDASNNYHDNGDQKNWWKSNYHYVLLKEVAHHFADQDRTHIFRGMWQGLRPLEKNEGGSSLLLITRPQYDIDYPLWDEARQVWAQNQPSLETFVGELREAGFQEIHHTIEAYPCSVTLERWQSMVKRRFWSTFSHFSDEQLKEACEKIAHNEQHRINDGVIKFEDRLLFISAKKV